MQQVLCSLDLAHQSRTTTHSTKSALTIPLGLTLGFLYKQPMLNPGLIGGLVDRHMKGHKLCHAVAMWQWLLPS